MPKLGTINYNISKVQKKNCSSDKASVILKGYQKRLKLKISKYRIKLAIKYRYFVYNFIKRTFKSDVKKYISARKSFFLNKNKRRATYINALRFFERTKRQIKVLKFRPYFITSNSHRNKKFLKKSLKVAEDFTLKEVSKYRIKKIAYLKKHYGAYTVARYLFNTSSNLMYDNYFMHVNMRDKGFRIKNREKNYVGKKGRYMKYMEDPYDLILIGRLAHYIDIMRTRINVRFTRYFVNEGYDEEWRYNYASTLSGLRSKL